VIPICLCVSVCLIRFARVSRNRGR
jgi:hypothetical protein